jgi:hypothetical protein
MKIVVTWFSCGRDAVALQLSADSVIRYLPGELVLVVVEDAKDPLPVDMNWPGIRLPGVDHGQNLNTLDSIANQFAVWMQLAREHRPKIILKIDSDVLMTRQYRPSDNFAVGQRGGSTRNGNNWFLLGGAYSFPAIWKLPDRAQVADWVDKNEIVDLLEDKIVSGMLAETCRLLSRQSHLGFHPFSHDLAESFTFVEFGRLSRVGKSFAKRDQEMLRISGI